MYFGNESIKDCLNNHYLKLQAMRKFPMLFANANDFEKRNCHGYRYYIPRDLLVFGEIYDSDYYGSIFNGKILDIGSNTGLFSFYALNHGASEIVAYEPYEPVYNVMVDRINVLQEQRITHYNKLVTDQTGLMPYRGLHTIGYVPESFDSNHFIQSVKASDIVDSSFSAIKMDVEGSEYPIIKDLYINNKLQCVDTYFVEIHNMGLTKNHVIDIFAMFEDAGFFWTTDITLLDSPYVHMLHFNKEI